MINTFFGSTGLLCLRTERGEAKGGRKKQKQIVKELLKAEVQDEIIIKTTQISKEELEKMKEGKTYLNITATPTK